MMRCKQDMIDAGERLVPRTCRAPDPLPSVISTMRRGDWMQTHTGLVFWPLDPRADEVRLEDIAAALSKICRYGGHTRLFYSVAEHSVLCASKAPDELKLVTLMHDASEAYLGDVIQPLKKWLDNYKAIEARVEQVIAERFGLPFPMPVGVKALDEAIIADERAQAMAPSPRHWAELDAVAPLDVRMQFWTPPQAQYAFMNAFYKYGGK